MVFCINDDRKAELKSLLEDLANYFYQIDDISGLFINAYYIHKPMGLDLDGSIEKDGINIRVDVVKKEGTEITTIYSYQGLKERLESIYEKTSINVIPVFSPLTYWTSESRIGNYTNKDCLISSGEILFDKDDSLIKKKMSLFLLEKRLENSVEFSPTLNLRRIENNKV